MVNETDKEQIEQLKKWFKEYGLSILLALIIGLGLGLGWRWYQTYQRDQQQQSVTEYQDAQLAYYQVKKADKKDKSKLGQAFLKQVTAFSEKHPHSTYTSLLDLLVAKYEVGKKNYDSALKYLRAVYTNKEEAVSIQQIAKNRAVRILREQNKKAEARALLNKISDATGAFDDLNKTIKDTL